MSNDYRHDLPEIELTGGAFTACLLLFVLFCTIVGSCNSQLGHNKNAEDAYQRLKKEGFSDKQIYEMGK